MHKCQICLNKYKNVKLFSSRISICGRCVNLLNNYNNPAQFAHNTLRERLLNKLLEKATIESSDPNFKLSEFREQEIARIMKDPHGFIDKILPEWINKKTASSSENSIEIKIIRAYRRGLIHYDNPNKFGRTNQWESISKAIKISDKMKCCMCNATNVELDTHHIVYVKKFGTNQKTNLISLCRNCHEKIHGRKLEFSDTDKIYKNAPLPEPEPINNLNTPDTNSVADSFKITEIAETSINYKPDISNATHNNSKAKEADTKQNYDEKNKYIYASKPNTKKFTPTKIEHHKEKSTFKCLEKYKNNLLVEKKEFYNLNTPKKILLIINLLSITVLILINILFFVYLFILISKQN